MGDFKTKLTLSIGWLLDGHYITVARNETDWMMKLKQQGRQSFLASVVSKSLSKCIALIWISIKYYRKKAKNTKIA